MAGRGSGAGISERRHFRPCHGRGSEDHAAGMSNRRWTIILVPRGASASRVIELSHTALKLVGSVAVAAVMGALLLGYATVGKTVNLARANAVARENARLAGELAVIQGQVALLADTVESLTKRDARFRVMANLEPLDPQVLAVGIGGPAPAHEQPAGGVLLARAEGVRVDLDALVRRANLLTRSFAEAADSLAAHADRLAATPSIMPTQGWLSSTFSARRVHPILHVGRPHTGIDITAPTGTPIEAPAHGVVVSSGWENGYGNMVVIDHGYGIVTKFAHASRLLVRAGERVARGQRIALVGSTGLSLAPHLHYEVHVNGHPVNPLKYILPDVVTD
jgi:murein DD-endopeptidase MepM/ murein hydrolase activator NlpD